jgi:hypothetical protein
MYSDSGIAKSYVDDRVRGQGHRLEDEVSKKGALKEWGRGVLPTRQQRQLATVASGVTLGAIGGRKYQKNKQQIAAGAPDSVPPALRRASKVAKAQRRVDPEYDRARRRGLLQGGAVGAAIPLGVVGSKALQRVDAGDSKSGNPSWRRAGVAVRATPSGRFPKGRLAAAGGSAALLTGAAMSQRRGTKDRNRRWT